MDLKTKDVAELLNVPETTVANWIDQGEIPAYRIDNDYRFSRTEVEDWVISRQKKNENRQGPLESLSGQGALQYSLFRAIHRGEVYHQVPGRNKEQIISHTMSRLSNQLDIDSEAVTELLLDRERMASTALNHGVSVPHTRDFLLSEHYDVVTIVYPEKPIDYDALDGEPVHTLFFLFACGDRRHLNLLAKIAHFVSSPETLELLKLQPTKEKLLHYIRDWESKIPHREKSR